MRLWRRRADRQVVGKRSPVHLWWTLLWYEGDGNVFTLIFRKVEVQESDVRERISSLNDCSDCEESLIERVLWFFPVVALDVRVEYDGGNVCLTLLPREG